MSIKKSVCLTLFITAALCGNTQAQTQAPNLLSNLRAPVDISSQPGIADLSQSSSFIEAVAVNMQALSKDAPAFNFNLGGDSYIVQQTHNYDMEGGYYSWNGSIDVPRSPGSNEVVSDLVNFVVSGNRLFGQIRLADKIYEISTLQNGQHVLAERDFTQLGYADDTPKSELAIAAEEVAATRMTSTVRVMQIASNTAINAAGGVSPIVDRMNFFISQSNQAYSATGIDINMQSAGLYRATNNERSTAQSNASGLKNLNDGFNDALANSTRNSISADLVGMIVATPNDPSICGIVNAIGGGASNGFFVVKYTCTDFTFVHEVGHLFGARHQNDPTTTPFSYGHGLASSAGNFRTIMGTTSTGLPRVGGFSNPDFTFNGFPFGTTSFSDNDRVHRERAATVAGFR